MVSSFFDKNFSDKMLLLTEPFSLHEANLCQECSLYAVKKKQDRFQTGFMTAAYHPESVLNVQKYKLLPSYGASFAAFWCEFCRLMMQILLHYDASFATLWPSTKKQSAVQKSIAFPRGGGGVCVCRSLSQDSMLLSKRQNRLCK